MIPLENAKTGILSPVRLPFRHSGNCLGAITYNYLAVAA
jgi:hypothetical protein